MDLWVVYTAGQGGDTNPNRYYLRRPCILYFALVRAPAAGAQQKLAGNSRLKDLQSHKHNELGWVPSQL